MADEFVNWFDSSITRFNNNSSPLPSSWTTSRNNNESIDSSVSVSDSTNNSMLLFQDWHDKFQACDDLGGSRGGVLMDHGLQMTGLGLSSQHVDWNRSFFQSGKPDGRSFGSILDEDQQLDTSINYQQNFQSLQKKILSDGDGGGGGEEESCLKIGGLSISGASNFRIDNSPVYENNASPSTMLQGFLGSPFENNHQRSMEFYPNYVANYDMKNTNEVLLPKFSHFMSSASTTSPPIQQLVTPQCQLHFSNNAKFWNAAATITTTTTATAMSDPGPLSFLPMHQQQFSTSPAFDEKIFKSCTSENKNSSSSMLKKSGSEVPLKRPRNETLPSPLPAFKVRKEKMGDRITALQVLVSPFGKTDTASVLSEATDYIKFLHEQVAVLSIPYMKNGASNHHHLHHQGIDTSKEIEEPKHDLRSRGLCLVPVSSTYPVIHETTVDFWTPTFGGTFR